ncbi:MAG: DinB family protein [Pedobacter sp.]|nr:MAG: DinB family protein [Pedobacter sp.]
MIENLKTIFSRDLNRLKIEIATYQDETHLWKISGDIKNSAGNLCLHLIGNLDTYIGAEIGKSGYIRNRELEFSLKDVPRAELLMMIEQTIITVNDALNKLSEVELEQKYPQIVLEGKTTTGFFLLHLTTHLSYHLGQINYHRRLIEQPKIV